MENSNFFHDIVLIFNMEFLCLKHENLKVNYDMQFIQYFKSITFFVLTHFFADQSCDNGIEILHNMHQIMTNKAIF